MNVNLPVIKVSNTTDIVMLHMYWYNISKDLLKYLVSFFPHINFTIFVIVLVKVLTVIKNTNNSPTNSAENHKTQFILAVLLFVNL